MNNPVFKTTGNPPRKSLAAQSVDFSAGEIIFREGDLGTEMYIISEGKVEILNRMGEDDRVLAVLEKGDFFGEMSVLEDLPRAATARALTDSRLLQINGSTFDQMLQSNPEIAVRMMRKLSRRLRETDELLKTSFGSRVSPVSREIPQQIDIAQDQGALGDDGDRVAAASQYRENAACNFEPLFQRLIPIGVDAQRDRFANVFRLCEFAFENFDRIGLVEQLCFKIQAGRQAQIRMGRTGKTVHAAVAASSIGIDRLVKPHIG